MATHGHATVRGGERVDYIPGISSTRLVDVPSPFIDGSREQEQMLNRILKYKPWVPKAQCVLFTSIYELESHTFDALRAEFAFPISTIGPVIPYLELGSEDSSLGIDRGNLNYIEWLDCQLRSSVLYISMGSFLSVSSTQITEIAAGLRDSGIKFLWVARGETCRLKEICGDIGLIVPWCHQLRVLSHSSIGGFLTHCGWNSVQEGVFCGVPFLTFPIAIDQPQNSRLIVEAWKTGWRVKQAVGEDKLVTREEIARLVQKFMDLENDEVKEMRRRAIEFQQICQRAIDKSGSSETNIDAFIRFIAQCLAC